MKISFFNNPKPRTFNYHPIYYDPDKEEAEERKKNREELQSDDHRKRIHAAFRRRLKKQEELPDRNSQVIRIFVYLIFAGFAIYLIFFTDFVTKLVSFFLR
jgi:hypothetical protein